MADFTSQRKITSLHYTIELPNEVLLAIIEKDRDLENQTSLYEKIAKVYGVEDVDYDGHYGPHIYIQVEAEHESNALWANINRLIKDYIK